MQLLFYLLFLFTGKNDNYWAYTVGNNETVKMYLNDNLGKPIGNFDRLKSFLKNETLIFATNGGMYTKDQLPVGLYIQDGKMIKPINRAKGSGNFCIQPNGMYYITNDNRSGVCKTQDFLTKGIKYATQSGPMLVIDGKISSAFSSSSKSLYVRNGVGILADGKAIFAISKGKVSFYDFAKYFKDLGCKNALYFDGGVSQMYPFKVKPYANFGVMIAVTNP